MVLPRSVLSAPVAERKTNDMPGFSLRSVVAAATDNSHLAIASAPMRILLVQRIISYLLRCDHETTHIDPIHFRGVAAGRGPFSCKRKTFRFCRGRGYSVRTPHLSLL